MVPTFGLVILVKVSSDIAFGAVGPLEVFSSERAKRYQTYLFGNEIETKPIQLEFDYKPLFVHPRL